MWTNLKHLGRCQEMKLVEAVALGNEFVTRTTKAIGDPILVRLKERELLGGSFMEVGFLLVT